MSRQHKQTKQQTPLRTLDDAVRFGARAFTRSGISFGHGTTNARDEAIWLAQHVLKLPLDRYSPERDLKNNELKQILTIFEQRLLTRKPAAYLTNEAWLGDYAFYVDERVIVPRSFIAEWLLNADSPWLPPSLRVKNALDLCTGSGCLAILLAKTFRGSHVIAADISSDALKVAQRNVACYRLQRRITLLESDYFSALRGTLRGKKFDLIISNPPYVTSAVMHALPKEYRHEPTLALAGGRDGLDAVRVILGQAANYLGDGGLLVVETGHARARVERTWPQLPFVWLPTSAGDDCVFALTREELVASPARAPASLKASARSRAPRRKATRRSGRV